MAKFNIDFTGAKEFTMCGKGEHDFKITNAELKSYTKNGETRQKIELTCEVFGGEDSGAKVFHSLFLKNPTGMFMFLNKIGIKVEKKVYSDMDTKIFIGKTFTATVEYETYTKGNGEIGNRAKIVDTTIRKYISTNTINDTSDEIDEDPFEEFANEIKVSELPFE